ncbi:MAG: hypothetical protein KatS3mg009_1308 [Acidimicrobiia bacterium]|nr:MAG: hypothetical protein KatS3mg009_1308 [Acidimicrobiia bacterium]
MATDVNSLDDLELELRKLPGVRAAGFDERDDVLLIQLHVAGETPEQQPVPVSASRIAARHSDRPVAVEVVRWREHAPTPPGGGGGADIDLADAEVVAEEVDEEARPASGPGERRPRLLAVLAFPDTDELEVHLILEGRRTIGRAAASRGLIGAVEATIDAVRGLGAGLDARARFARALEDTGDERVLVAVALDHGGDAPHTDYGLAAGASPVDAAARSTLDALNRRLARML